MDILDFDDDLDEMVYSVEMSSQKKDEFRKQKDPILNVVKEKHF